MLDFQEWVRLLFGTEGAGNDEGIMTLFADDDADAVRLYFDLFDDFLVWRRTPDAITVTLRGAHSSIDGLVPRHTLESFLTVLRERPACYIGPRLLSRMTAYIRGFVGAQQDMGLKEGKELFDEFDRFVRQQYRTEVEHDAESLIIFHHFEDHASIEPFWKLFDDFIEQRGKRGR